jgi:hypothetical protein
MFNKINFFSGDFHEYVIIIIIIIVVALRPFIGA